MHLFSSTNFMSTFALSTPPSAFAMPLLSARVKTVLLHLGVWLAYYLFEVGFILLSGVQMPNQWDTTLNWMLYAVMVYANALWLFPSFFVPRRYLAY